MSDKLSSKPSSNIASLLMGAGLILLDILFLIGRYVGIMLDFDIWHYAWSFIFIAPGLPLTLPRSANILVMKRETTE